MQALISAGGKGTRLVDVTNDQIPKPMAKIGGTPILERTIQKLKENGIKDIFITVSHLAEKIIDYFKDGKSFGVNIKYFIEKEPLGSAGALYYLKEELKDDFLICSGDVVFDIDINRMYKYHKEKNAVVTLLTHPNLHPFDSDLIIADKQNRVIKIDYKNNVRDYYYKNNVNAGFVIVNAKTLDYFDKPQKVNLEKDFINELIKNDKEVFAYKSSEYIKDVGTLERFTNTEKDIENHLVEKKCLKNKQKAIFLDRDGVINKYKGFITSPDQIELEKDVENAIKLINGSEYLAIIVSNQPVIARGDATFEEVENIFNKIETLLGNAGCFVDGIYFCPHHPHSGFDGEVKELKIKCECRKPNIGMLKQAEKDFNLDMKNCIIVGDSNLDVQTGINANIKQIKVKSDLKEEQELKATYNAENLYEAVKIILKEGKNEKQN